MVTEARYISQTCMVKVVLNFFYVNACSLRNKITDLQTLAYTNDYDIIGISESLLDTNKHDFLAEYNLSGYAIFSNERHERHSNLWRL